MTAQAHVFRVTIAACVAALEAALAREDASRGDLAALHDRTSVAPVSGDPDDVELEEEA